MLHILVWPQAFFCSILKYSLLVLFSLEWTMYGILIAACVLNERAYQLDETNHAIWQEKSESLHISK